MAIARRTPAATIGGIQRWKAKSLFDVMTVAGFDPSADGSEWVLIANDLHCAYAATVPQADSFDARIVSECAALAAHAPVAVVINGDVLTNLVSSYGNTANTTDGLLESAAVNASMPCFTNLSTVYMVLGNHDTPVDEDPLGSFMATNCDDFGDLNHTFTAGGTKWILLSTSHDNALIDGQIDYLDTQLATANATQEIVICSHQPHGGRGYEHQALPAIVDAIPAEMTNPIWHFSGHAHRWDQSVCFNAGSTTIASCIVSAGGTWVFSADDTLPALCAVACRGGEVVARFAWDGKDEFWHYVQDFDRSSPIDIPRQLDGVSGLTVLSQYLEGFYDRTGRFNNAASGFTYRIAGTWLAYCYDVRVNFPIPDGATKFWYVSTAKPTSLAISDDNSIWVPIDPIPDLSSGAIIIDIPSPLQSADYLYVRATTGGHHISAWGFAL